MFKSLYHNFLEITQIKTQVLHKFVEIDMFIIFKSIAIKKLEMAQVSHKKSTSKFFVKLT